jgi:bacteriorhodopsin
VFLYGYLITGLLSTFAGILGAAQMLTSAYPWGFWIVGAMALVALVLYLSAQLGQKLGAWQTFQLHQAYQTAIGQPADIR